MIRHTKNIKKYNAVLLLLCLTFLFITSKESFHVIVEHSSSQQHECITEIETSDCHQFLVHHVKSDNCKGDHDHLVQKEEKCFKCESFKEKNHLFYKSCSDCVKESTCLFLIDGSITQGSSASCGTAYLRGPPKNV